MSCMRLIQVIGATNVQRSVIVRSIYLMLDRADLRYDLQWVCALKKRGNLSFNPIPAVKQYGDLTFGRRANSIVDLFAKR